MPADRLGIQCLRGFGRAVQSIDLGGQDEVVLGEAADGVRGQGERDPLVADGDVRVVAFAPRDVGHGVDEGYRLLVDESAPAALV